MRERQGGVADLSKTVVLGRKNDIKHVSNERNHPGNGQGRLTVQRHYIIITSCLLISTSVQLNGGSLRSDERGERMHGPHSPLGPLRSPH